MIQDILAESAWAERLTAEDKRGVNPLFTSNMTPYGEVKLNMTSRLDLSDPRRHRPRPKPSPPDRPARRATGDGTYVAPRYNFVGGSPNRSRSSPGRSIPT